MRDYRLEELGANIKAARSARSMSLRELGKRTGISFSHLSAIENGKHSPSFLDVYDISKALKISLKKLF